MSDGTSDEQKVARDLLSAAQHAELKARLSEIPDTVPPRAVWERIEAQASAEGLLQRPVLGERTRWLAGAAIAAGVVLAVLNFPALAPPETDATVAGVTELRTEPEFNESATALRLQSINALMVRSQFLERDLRRLPDSPQLMRADTAATIDELHDRIAAIDDRLNQPDIVMTRAEQELYWRERVRLMDSLVKLRLAQSQRGTF